MYFWQEDLSPADQSQVRQTVTIHRNQTKYGRSNGYILKLQMYFGKTYKRHRGIDFPEIL